MEGRRRAGRTDLPVRMIVSRKSLLLLLAGSGLNVPLLYLTAVILEARRITPSVADRARRFEEGGLRITDLPGEWKEILLRVEDPGFYRHGGVDLSTPGAGLTTITQGLVKAHHFERFWPGIQAKLRQSLYAIVLDWQLEKDLQLTLFLNTASLGPSGDTWVTGFPEAARTYFAKPFPALERAEFVTLVAMLIGPAAYHPQRAPEALADRVSRIDALLAGECEPTGPRDVYHEACSR